ncbi:MAG TPA: hypothetical protein VIT68_01980 [Candidatus Gracilibacteria bacterium]
MFLQKDCFRYPDPEAPSGGEFITAPEQVDEKIKEREDLDTLQADIEMGRVSLISFEAVLKEEYGFKDKAEFNDFLAKYPHMAGPLGRSVMMKTIQHVFDHHGDLVFNFKKALHRPHNMLREDFEQTFLVKGKRAVDRFTTTSSNVGANFGVGGGDAIQGEADSSRTLSTAAAAFVSYGLVKFGATKFSAAAGNEKTISEHLPIPLNGTWRMESLALGAAGQAFGLPVGEAVSLAPKAVFKGVEIGAQNAMEFINNPQNYLASAGDRAALLSNDFITKSENKIESGEFFQDQLKQIEYFPDKIQKIARRIIEHQRDNPEVQPGALMLTPAETRAAAEYCVQVQKVTFSNEELVNFTKGVLRGNMDEIGAERFMYTSSHNILVGFFTANPNARDTFAQEYDRAMNDDLITSSLLELEDTPNSLGLRDLKNPDFIPADLRADRAKIHEEMLDLKNKLDPINRKKILGVIDPQLGLVGNLGKLYIMASVLGWAGSTILTKVLGLDAAKKDPKTIENTDSREVDLGKFESCFKKDGKVFKPEISDGKVDDFLLEAKKQKLLSPLINVITVGQKVFLTTKAYDPKAKNGKGGVVTLNALDGTVFEKRKATVDFTQGGVPKFTKFVSKFKAGKAGEKDLRTAFLEDLKTGEGAGFTEKPRFQRFAQAQESHFTAISQLRTASESLLQKRNIKLSIDVAITAEARTQNPDLKTPLNINIPARSEWVLPAKSPLEKFYKGAQKGGRFNNPARGRFDIPGTSETDGGRSSNYFMYFQHDGTPMLGYYPMEKRAQGHGTSGVSYVDVPNKNNPRIIGKITTLTPETTTDK